MWNLEQNTCSDTISVYKKEKTEVVGFMCLYKHKESSALETRHLRCLKTAFFSLIKTDLHSLSFFFLI